MKNGSQVLDTQDVKLPTGHILRYYIGDLVYVKTDPDQYQRMVTGILLCPGKAVMYRLSIDNEAALYYAEEISPYKNVTL